MVIKSLTITEEAYKSLKRLKYEDESFSKAILRIAKEKSNAINRYFGTLRLSEKEAKEWKNNINNRRREISKELEDRIKKLRKTLH